MRPIQHWTAIALALFALLAIPSGSALRAGDDPAAPPIRLAVVRVYYASPAQRSRLLLSFKAQLLETNRQAGYHLMQLTPGEIDRLTRAGFRVQADPEWQAPPRIKPSASQAGGIPGYPCYRTIDETLTAARRIAQDYPHLAAWQDIGDSWEKTAGAGGHDLFVLRLTNRARPGPKPVLLLTAAIHGREYATTELVMRFVESLVRNYDQDADVTWILDHHEVHAILYANPDGREQAETGILWRKNTNTAYCTQNPELRGADLNRNFDFLWNCCGGSSSYPCALNYHGAAPASEPEIQSLQDYMQAVFADQRGPDLRDAAPDDAGGLFLDVHSYGELVLWPWGFSGEPAPNGAQLQTLGRKLAYSSRYTPMQAIGLYPTDGASDDYAYGRFGVASYTLELGTQFFQSCQDFETTILPGNLPALLYAARVARAPYRLPSGPDSLDLSLDAQQVTAGAPVALRATLDDTRHAAAGGSEPSQSIVAAEWYLDTPPWQAGAEGTPMDVLDGAWDSSREEVSAGLDTAGWSPGRHILFVRGQDADGNWGPVSADVLFISEPADQRRLFFPYLPAGRAAR